MEITIHDYYDGDEPSEDRRFLLVDPESYRVKVAIIARYVTPSGACRPCRGTGKTAGQPCPYCEGKGWWDVEALR
jgi:hypothetical protein